MCPSLFRGLLPVLPISSGHDAVMHLVASLIAENSSDIHYTPCLPSSSTLSLNHSSHLCCAPLPPPPTTWIASSFSCLCCAWPCGLVAVMYSMKVNCWLNSLLINSSIADEPYNMLPKNCTSVNKSLWLFRNCVWVNPKMLNAQSMCWYV